jgi:transposase
MAKRPTTRPTPREEAFDLFAKGVDIRQVARAVGRDVRTLKRWKAQARAAAKAVAAGSEA